MVKILSVVPYKIFPAKVGGQKGIALFTEYLAREVDLTCVTVKANDAAYAKGYSLLNILSDRASRYANLSYFFTLRKLVRNKRITHLLLEHPYFGWLGILLKKTTGVSLIVHSHNIESTRWKSLGKWWWKILWRYERIIHRHADFNFFIHDEDREYALKAFGLSPHKCTTITYGIEIEKTPGLEERQRCSKILRQKHNIGPNEAIFLFNGALDYKPNYDGVLAILHQINPLLLETSFAYKIIVCGRGLPATLNELKDYADKHIVYAGFVDDITVYFKGADVFINPIVDGGGIKTKLVEALGYNTKAVSTLNGSIGLNRAATGRLLTIVPDKAWPEFIRGMTASAGQPFEETPPAFYQHFYWGNIARKAAAFISPT